MIIYVLYTRDMKLVDSLSKSSINVNYPCSRWLTLSFSTYISIEFTYGCNSSIVHVCRRHLILAWL